MLQNYFKIAWRNLFKSKLFSFINIFGLALGIAVGLLMFLYVQHEWSYDKWIPQSENIYRIYRQWGNASGKGSTVLPSILGSAVREEFPEIESSTRFFTYGETLLTNEDGKSIYVKDVAGVDSLFLQTVPLELLEGDATTALQNKLSLLLSEKTARNLYGRTNVVGEVVKVDDDTDMLITGVLPTPVGNSHLNKDVYILRTDFPPYWTGAQGNIYLRLHPSADVAALEQKITKLANYHYAKESREFGNETLDESKLPFWGVQSLHDVHLKSSHLGGYSGKSGSYRTIGILAMLGFIVLLIASINYVNLSTARAAKRAREVGIRKVAGATRQQTIFQFLAETGVQSLLALLLAVGLVYVLLPFFNEIVQRDLTVSPIYTWTFLPILLVFSVLVSLLAGSYPAFYLSHFRPIVTLKGDMTKRREVRGLRESLVVVQFALAITLIIYMSFIWKQVNYMSSQELGFNGSQVVVVELHNEGNINKVLRNPEQIRRLPGVENVSLVAQMPGDYLPNYGVEIAGQEGIPYVDMMFTDAHFADVLDITVKEGRFFSEERIQYDTANAFVVNETFVKTFGLENPIGHRMQFPGDEAHPGTIIGVVQDFHYRGLQNEVKPLAISARQDMAWLVNTAIKISDTNIPATLAELEKAWKQIEPAHPIRYTFLDEFFARQYEDYLLTGRTILYTTVLSIFIALLGLFGLATFMAEQRTKEIGIRKVLGASLSNLISLQVKGFVGLILIAGLIAVPVGYLLVRNWLEDFAYQTAISTMPFILAIAVALVIALLTVSTQAWRVSSSDPVKAIKYE